MSLKQKLAWLDRCDGSLSVGQLRAMIADQQTQAPLEKQGQLKEQDEFLAFYRPEVPVWEIRRLTWQLLRDFPTLGAC